MVQEIYYDEYGQRYAKDENGNRIVPMQAEGVKDPSSGWTVYDESQGHCGLCGRLTCNGGCFK